ncbi:MAG: CPBP family intramembrane glutamic endopeptidase, partial [Gemmatimonadota bacterium]|nr:CPBP family intramembrane glutamic endopeptidase [Gemmatimonadota bacterium]
MTVASGPGVRRRPRWLVWTFLFLPAVLLTLLIVGYMAARGLDPVDPIAERVVRRALPYLIAANHVTVFGLLLLALRLSGETLRDIGWSVQATDSTVARELAVGVLCALGLYLFKELVIDSVRMLAAGHTPTYTSLFRFSLSGLEVPLALVGTLLVFVEESVYRGYVLPWLEERRGVGWAVGISSAAFGLLHWGNGP